MTPDKNNPDVQPRRFTVSQQEQENLPELSQIRTFSFQAPPQESASHFCQTFLQIQALNSVGKRIGDANVIVFNSTQKEMVQTIVQHNKHRSDQKSKFLYQRANKFLKLLWKTQKYSDPYQPNQESRKRDTQPTKTSPISSFKHHKLTRNNSFGTQVQKEKTRSTGKTKREAIHKIAHDSKVKETKRKTPQSSRVHSLTTEERKFEKIKLSPNGGQSRIKEKDSRVEKTFQIDLTKNITWKTMLTTKNFDNMLKVLQQ